MIGPLRRIHRRFWLVWPLLLIALLVAALLRRAPDAADAESYHRVTSGAPAQLVPRGDRP